MPLRWLAGLCLALAVLPVRAEIARGLVEPSAILGRDIPYSLYRSDGADAAARLPVLYLLHGHGGTANDWLDAGGLADAVAAVPNLPPMLVAMPGLGNSWYVDSDAFGPVATAFLDEFMPAVETRWNGDPRKRAIAGLSMGGFGALHLALRAPDRFLAVGAFSPAILPPGASMSALQRKLYGSVFGEPFDRRRLGRADPFRLLESLPGNGRLPAFYLMSGDDDEFGLERGTIRFYLRLRAIGAEPELRIRDGGHRWRLWREELPGFLAFLARRWKAEVAPASHRREAISRRPR